MQFEIPPEVGRGSKRRVLEFLLAKKGRIVTSDQIRKAARSSEWARRLRELRNDHGYQILSHKDRSNLKPGQYLLASDERSPVLPRGISKETRAFVLDRNGYSCQSCGVAAADDDPLHPGQKVRLVMGHILDRDKGGLDSAENLRALCSSCNEGLQNIALPRPNRIALLKTIRRATVDDQLAALEWLETKFKNVRRPKQ